MKNKISNIILVLVFFIGLSLLLYPSFADYWNSFTSSKAIATYTEDLATISDEDYEQLWETARQYNQALLERKNVFAMDEERTEQYLELLDISGSGIMGYVEIPNINVELPIYHGTSEGVLQIAIGHLDWTSLPVGGESTHCVISGHRGLPSARLFTDLDEMVEGDIFLLHILDETLTYQVDQILIIEPDKIADLMIEEGKDLCTMMTCTPYGINSHRLLVRGHRIETEEEAVAVRVSSDAMQVEPLVVAPILAVPILLILLVLLTISDGVKKSKKKK